MASDFNPNLPKKRELPKLIACITRNSLDNMRNRTIYSMNMLDSKTIRRRKLPLHECLTLELRETGYMESADYFSDIIYENVQVLAEDDIGIVVNLMTTPHYLEYICKELMNAENARSKGETKKECLHLLGLAQYFAEQGKGILWLAEKFFLASIAVASQYLVDGGRLKGCCKYHYGTFLLDKFPGADQDEAFQYLTEVRDTSIGKERPDMFRTRMESFFRDNQPYSSAPRSADMDMSALPDNYYPWLLYESPEEWPKGLTSPAVLLQVAALQLHRILMSQARQVHKKNPSKAERLARLAERRGIDAQDTDKTAEAIIEIGICQLTINNLNNAQKTLERAFKIHEENQNIQGLCECKMHMSAVMQRLGNHEAAAKLLTEMGAMAMENGLRLYLGRALYLIGELHLRRERPELGTQYLQEAFACFMGFNWQYLSAQKSLNMCKMESDVNDLFRDKEIYEDEAEQSRLMMAISAGQEKMASYFNVLRNSKQCTINKMKIIEWKLSYAPWWIQKKEHDLLPCPCPDHNRSPLDVLRYQLDAAQKQVEQTNESLTRQETIQDFRELQQPRESHVEVQPSDTATAT